VKLVQLDKAQVHWWDLSSVVPHFQFVVPISQLTRLCVYLVVLPGVTSSVLKNGVLLRCVIIN